VHAVVLGAGVPPGRVRAVLRALSGRRGGAPVVVVPGSRAAAGTLEPEAGAVGWEDAGVSVIEHGAGVPLSAPPEDALGLCLGVATGELPGAPERWWLAGPATCAASALAGRVTEGALAADEAPAVAVTVAVPASRDAGEVGGALPALELPTPPGESVRGVVLGALGDDVGAAELLPWGPRLRPALGSVAVLAGHVLAERDAGFAARARAAGGGFLLAGERFGHGVARDSAALALAALGVRAVLARSFAAAFERRLAASGVLPLLLEPGAGGGAPAPGHELELPGLAAGLAPGGTVGVRDLTDGRGYTARHGLDARAAGLVAAGGRLRALRALREAGAVA
jgi:aconitate hydratase